MSCKQHTKNKPIKWRFKCWCWGCSKTGYLYQFDLYLDKKIETGVWVRSDSCFKS